MNLHEAASIIKRNRFKKVKAFAGRNAISICKAENPSLYNKYKRYKDMFRQLKAKIESRYGNRALVQAKRKIK